MATSPITRTRSGEVRGLVRPNETVAFLGIPYQANPQGNPYAAPTPPPTWTEPFLAQSYGPSAPQPPDSDPIIPQVIVPPGPAGCLNLNIFTSSLDGHRPVMVYIHGGSFTAGSNAFPWYEGSPLAADGAVVVTVNYRLGVYGFSPLNQPSVGVVPNLGLRDIVAALEWVRDNIAAFGGDPDRVTLWGQSAGAVAVCIMLAAPQAQGLFQRAIVQSSNPEALLSQDDAALVAQRLALGLGAPQGDDLTLARYLGTASSSELMAIEAAMAASVLANPDPTAWGSVALNYLPFAPLIDGDLLPAGPIEAAAAGLGNGIELLIGYNTDEFNLFTIPSGLADLADQSLVEGLAGLRGLEPQALGAYGAGPEGTNWGAVWNAMMTDWMYRRPTLALVEARNQAGARPSYVYQFAWDSPAYEGRLGACHALEVPFVFGAQDQPGARVVLGDSPPGGLSPELRSAWLAFAKTGVPPWPAYQTSDPVCRRFDAVSENVLDPFDQAVLGGSVSVGGSARADAPSGPSGQPGPPGTGQA
ncbi:MAG: carboxylesterase family protein [Bifidobacteriaceae bacterium]|nr:carboxylesterase family protein [Bifidobacteriaceae bacterium]